MPLYTPPMRGSWTPVLTFATPGDLSVVYSAQLGWYERSGKIVTAFFNIATSTFTFTTAASTMLVSGLPFAAAADSLFKVSGGVAYQGITKANYGHVEPFVSSGGQQMGLLIGGSGQSLANVSATDMPSGGSVILRGSVIYNAA